VHTRLLLERQFQDSLREGFAMIAAGFGSFAVFDGLAAVRDHDALPKTFALAITAIGIVLVALATVHHRKMVAWADADEFGAGPAPALPDERRPYLLAAGAASIGIVSFVALLLVP
jgi:hypothetical protein